MKVLMKKLTIKISRSIVFASLVCSLLIASSGYAQDEEDAPRTAESLGVLNDIVTYGDDGNWTTSVEGNNCRIHGPDAVNYVKYYYINTNEKHCCLLYTSPSPRDGLLSRMPSSA